VSAPLLDTLSLGRRAEQALGDQAPITDVVQLTGGTSSLTYSATWKRDQGAASVVIKVAPPGLAPVRNRDVLRQARLLRALAGTGVRVPRVLAESQGAPPEVPPLYVMEFVPGESFEPMQADDQGRSAATTEQVRGRVREALSMLATMHRVDPSRLGLDEERVVSPADELERWRRAFATTEGDLHPEIVDRVHRLLAANVPASMPPAIVHGDWRLGNMQCHGGEVRAVIDWEIWTIGDPRLDLAWFLLMADPARQRAVPNPGMPRPEDLLQEYESETGRALEAMTWFAALVRFKQAAASALICKNNRKSTSPSERGLAMGQLVEPLAARAFGLLSAK
jgi:aminoglycoside phosphotransferase (APT) family kinase protein